MTLFGEVYFFIWLVILSIPAIVLGIKEKKYKILWFLCIYSLHRFRSMGKTHRDNIFSGILRISASSCKYNVGFDK